MYLSYDDYISRGGTLSESAFSSLEFRAEKTIDLYTFGRLKELQELPTEIPALCLELIDKLDPKSDIVSASNDGVSVSYKQNDTPSEAEDLITAYLSEVKLSDGTPILFRGC